MGKIVTAYNSGQCEINSAHSWEPRDEIYWNKNENGVVVQCTKKACYESQGGKCDGTIEKENEEKKPEKRITIDKHTGQHVKSDTVEDDANIHGIEPTPTEHDIGEQPHAKEMDVTDFAADALKAQYTTLSKELKIAQEALMSVFPDIKDGAELGNKLKILFSLKYHTDVQ